ncbi:efflux transporter outer membrane subunit [Sphingomonas sp.]|uniref:efflux transporter outer membrane subunit n=1 Tax=Sphingomonas sp. TaxID=28214 RepID=UPI003B3A21D7
MMRRIVLGLSGALALAGCAVGPDYHAPKLVEPAKQPFLEGQNAALLSSQPLPARWWELFADPVLDRLIADAFAYNTDIARAEANLRQARGVLSEQRAGLLPTTNTSAQYTHGRIGVQNTGVGGAGTVIGGGGGDGTNGPSGFNYDYYQVGFDASYELDVFGRVRRSIEAARGDYQAQAAALDGVRISVAAQVAQSYADACGYAEQADVARETARLQSNTLSLTQRLLEAGRGTRRDVDQAAVTVERANAQVPPLEASRRAEIYALAALTGRPPAELDQAAAACRAVPKIKTAIPIGDGATLLARRPDVRQAERTLAADTARIGIATAALFPQINLLGSIGLGAPRVSDVGKSSSFSYSIGPLISWSFPNIAVARARIAQARAGSDASLAGFQGTVLNALRETESALARYTAALTENAALARASAAASDAAELSRLRFTTGRDSFLNLLVAEQDRAAARIALAQSDTTVAEQAVSLFKALGGGWENAAPTVRAAPAAQSSLSQPQPSAH